MIPIDLLRAVRRGRLVRPRYLEGTEAAEAVLGAYRSARRLGDARAAVEALPLDERLKWGLAHLAEKELELEPVDRRLVMRVRLELFREAARAGYPTSEEERRRIVEAVAARLRMAPEAVEEAFRKAYEDSLAIARPPGLSAEELVARYNLALMQALLFKSLYLRAWVSNEPAVLKGLVRALKGFGLMYVADVDGGDVLIHVDGPVSAVRQTERYGTRLAKLLPYIAAAGRWRIEAAVRVREREYLFQESSATAPRLPPPPPREEEFDSSVEQEFYRQVSRLCPLQREPEALVVDRRIYIPDFKLGDLYIEIVGFWTPDYIRRKYEKLAKVGKPILVLVDEELAMATWRALPHYVAVFKGRPRLSDVFKYLKPHCKKHP